MTCAVLALLAGGCSGINASKSVSPLDFFLPGLMQTDPPASPATQQPDLASPSAKPVKQVAQN